MSAIGNSRDSSSYANIDEVEPIHLAMDFAVDFKREVFDGSVTHTLRAIVDGVTNVFFDSEGIDIAKVEYLDSESVWW